MNWEKFHSIQEKQSYFKKIIEGLRDEQRNYQVFPPDTMIYRAFSLTAFKDVKVVILGQDPYHGEGQADGLAFSSETPPPSLRNIFKELEDDLGIQPPATGDLTRWAEQGVLLLNTTLTVRKSEAASHKYLGWETYTDHVIQYISENKEHVVFLLWGSHAKSKVKFIDQTKHLVLTAVHPSPLSSYRGFFGCKHFSRTNSYLQKHNLPVINW